MSECGKRNAECGIRPRAATRLSLAVLGALLLAAGCESMSGNRTASATTEIDPLVGGPPIPAAAPSQPAPGTASPASTATASTAGSTASTVPPLPSPNSVTSPAALTSGANPTLNPGQRITPPAGAAGATPAREWNSQPSGAVLRGPQPVPDPLPVPPTTLAPTPSVALASGTRPATGDSYQQLQEALTARGVTWQTLESVDNGEWKFNCSVPNRLNPNLGRRYEARGRSAVEAIRNALDKIDRDQQPAGL